MHKERKSNIELLRIVAILFIISHHFLVHGMKIWGDSTWDNITLLSLDAAFFVGVNVFVLISGFCGIQFKWKKLLYLYLITASIGGFCYFAHLFIDGASLGRSVIYNTIFSISHAHGTWFVKVYLYLFLLSPLINKALESFDKKQIRFVLLLLTIICVYFGWFWQDAVNPDGYNLINFIWIYCIGYYLRHFVEFKKIKPIYYLLIWLNLSILNAILSILFDSYVAWAYNNPLVIIAAIAFFLSFISFDFSSKSVNLIASSTLGVYLLHEHVYISPLLYKEQYVSFYSENIINFIVSISSLFVICCIIDILIRNLVANPLLKIISYLFSKNNK